MNQYLIWNYLNKLKKYIHLNIKNYQDCMTNLKLNLMLKKKIQKQILYVHLIMDIKLYVLLKEARILNLMD